MITTVEVLILQFNTCLIRNVLKESYTVFRKNDIQSNAIQDVIDYCYKEKFIDHEDYAESLKTP